MNPGVNPGREPIDLRQVINASTATKLRICKATGRFAKYDSIAKQWKHGAEIPKELYDRKTAQLDAYDRAQAAKLSGLSARPGKYQQALVKQMGANHKELKEQGGEILSAVHTQGGAIASKVDKLTKLVEELHPKKKREQAAIAKLHGQVMSAINDVRKAEAKVRSAKKPAKIAEMKAIVEAAQAIAVSQIVAFRAVYPDEVALIKSLDLAADFASPGASSSS